MTGAATYTEADVQAQVRQAVDAAVGELRTELDQLRASQEEQQIATRIEDAVAAATASLSARVAELETALDAATVEAAGEKARADGLQVAIATATAEAEVAERRDTRLEAVKATGLPFKAEYLTANAQRWAEMDEAAFDAFLADCKEAAGDQTNDGIPTTTALTAAVLDSGGAPRGAPGPNGQRRPRAISADIAKLARLRQQGIDIRKV